MPLKGQNFLEALLFVDIRASLYFLIYSHLLVSNCSSKRFSKNNSTLKVPGMRSRSGPRRKPMGPRAPHAAHGLCLQGDSGCTDPGALCP